jgi:general stress protein 26
MFTTTTESKETQTGIVNDKIMELQSALFFTESASLLKLPTHVISNVAGIDNDGQIWFVIPRPVQKIEEFEREIPAKLDFFKKGVSFYVKVKGKAILMNDHSEIDGDATIAGQLRERMMNDKSVIAVKVKIQDTEYVDNTPKASPGWMRASRMQLSSWFF